MHESCRQYRSEWMDGSGRSVHPESCAECAAWTLARERTLGALAQLDRLVAPPELERAVAAELGGDRARRLERVLRSLVRRHAPAVLDQRVAESLATAATGDEASGARKAAVLGALDVQRAPAVLERLLDEELAAPERARAERFPGSLPRLTVPEALAERVDARVRRRALARLWIGPVSALSAAALVVWMALRSDVPDSRGYRFEVRHAASLDGLDPMARVLAESLGGGAPR